MDYKDLTKEDIEQFELDIKKYNQYRNAMKWSALGSFGGAIAFLILLFYFRTVQYQFYEISLFMVFVSVAAGITLFILRSALFNSRINRREALIRKFNKQQKENQIQ